MEERNFATDPAPGASGPPGGAGPVVVSSRAGEPLPQASQFPELAVLPDAMEIATLRELRLLQTRSVNGLSAVVLLAVSAALFVLMSRSWGRQQSWEYIAIIVGILLFHEVGHYIAMKTFGYRNLRMFFIPGFGAAVSGRHYNAPAWKKIVVSLMGPLPGIAAGIVALSLSGFLHNDLLYRIGLFATLINAFNLVPILPFDGGWVAHAAIFSRHPKLDMGFRLVAVLLLVGIAIKVPGMHVLFVVAFASLLAIPVAAKLAAIVAELRKLSALGVSPDDQTIPLETERIILARIRRRFARNLHPRFAAQHVASVFESLNARPPSVGATIGLLSLHATGLVLAVLVAAVAIVAHRQSPFRRQALDPAKYVLTPDELQTLGDPPAGRRNTLVATFASNSLARSALAGLSPGRPATLYGQTLLISFAPTEAQAQRDLFQRWEKSTEDIFVESPKMRTMVHLTFKLPDTETGRQAWRDLELCLQGHRWRLIPPWAAEADWPAPQRAAQTRMRELVKDLQAVPADFIRSRQDQWKQIVAAQRRGDTDEAARLQAEIQKAQEDAERAKEQRLKDRYGHPEFIDQWDRLRSAKDWKARSAWLVNEVAPQLGQWPADKPDDLLVTDGHASDTPQSGKRVFCQFAQTDTGLMAMTRWLFSQGATDVRYAMSGIPAEEDDTLDGPD